MPMPLDMENLVQAVKDHALAHYSQGGWDIVFESLSREEIAAELRLCGAATPQEAVRTMHEWAALKDEQRKAAEALWRF